MKQYVRWLIILSATIAIPTLMALQFSEAKRSDKKKTSAERTAKSSMGVPVGPAIRTQSQSSTPVSAHAVEFAISPRISELPEKTELSESFRRGKVETNQESPEKNVSPALSGQMDFAPAGPAVSTGSPLVPATIANFEAISNQDNATHPAIGFFVNPPDTVGDVGPSQYVQATNLLFRVYDKTGAPQTALQPISALFAGLGPPCSNNDDGDPIVLYDSFADRWIITQFMVSGSAPLSQCFAISQTGDAAGVYYTYRFVMPNSKFNDYPKFGVWPDGYYW